MFYNLLLVFIIGSILGWFLEIFWRNLKVDKKIDLNPGFLKGPYILSYGFGLVLLYLINFLNINLFLKILFSGIALTLIELAGSLFLKKIFNIKLWDYSNFYLNFKGHICLAYFFIWCILSALFHLNLYKILLSILYYLAHNNITNIFILIFYIIIISDFILKSKKKLIYRNNSKR